MRRLVNDLLDAAAFEAGRLALDRRPGGGRRARRRGVRPFEPQAAERQVRLERDLGDDAEATVFAD
jgi:signal transduction histidine kinase